MPSPLVSVITPAFNGERFIAESIESVLAQTYGPVELIVVDDGSTDATADVVSRFPEARLIRQGNAGPAAARNAAVSASTGELLAFHDQDDLMLPRKLEVQVGALTGGHGAGVSIAPDQEFRIEEGATPPDWDRVLAPALFENAEEAATFVGSITLVMWREVFDRVGPFDPGIFGGDDLDWMLRATEMGIEFAVAREKLLCRRVHVDNISQDTETCRRALLSCFRARVARRRGAGVSPEVRLGPPPAPA